MTIGAVLLAYAVCVGTLSSRALGRARWTSRAPQLAIYAYLTAAWSTLAASGWPASRWPSTPAPSAVG